MKKTPGRPHRGSQTTKRTSLPKSLKPEDLTFEKALGLIQLPRLLGEHPEGGKVQSSLGRFGPYVVWSKNDGDSSLLLFVLAVLFSSYIFN